VLREVIQQEFLRVISQLHTDLREQLRDQQEHLRDDLHQEEAAIIAEMKARERRSDDRLAGLIIRAIREGGMSRRMLFTYLAKDDSSSRWKCMRMLKPKLARRLSPDLMSFHLVSKESTAFTSRERRVHASFPLHTSATPGRDNH